MSAANGEYEYDRAWRERGEAERALRLWNRSQQSPRFVKGAGILGGIMGGLMICGAIKEMSWTSIPVILLGMLFASMLWVGPATLRDDERNREEAKATLKRLGVWK
jgi:hypothetical protein